MTEKNLWRRECCKIITDDYEVMESWKYESESVDFNISIRYFECAWGVVRQVMIQKNFEKSYMYKLDISKEPTMREKIEILESTELIERYKEAISLEVFPEQEKIVDNIDMYHLWVVEKSEVPFVTNFKMPRICIGWKKVNINGKPILYKIKKSYGSGKNVKICFLKSQSVGQELQWYDKQKFKDYVFGEDVVAVEKTLYNINYISVLIVLPKLIKLPFGLKNSNAE